MGSHHRRKVRFRSAATTWRLESPDSMTGAVIMMTLAALFAKRPPHTLPGHH
jgi:hypothetical protein